MIPQRIPYHPPPPAFRGKRSTRSSNVLCSFGRAIQRQHESAQCIGLEKVESELAYATAVRAYTHNSEERVAKGTLPREANRMRPAVWAREYDPDFHTVLVSDHSRLTE
jgi:hypothetical protein